MNTNLNISSSNNSDTSEFQLKKAKLAKFAKLSEISKSGGMNVQKRAQIAKAARGFESMFVNMMLKEMKNAMLPKSDPKGEMGSFGAESLQGYTDVLWSEEIANTGKGIGIAQMIYKQLTGGEDLQSKTQTLSQFNPNSIIEDVKRLSKKSDENKIQPSDISQKNLNNNLNKINIEKYNLKLSDYDSLINSAGKKHGISPSLIKSIISAESSANPNAVSKAGAKGLMQLMDNTSKELGIKNSFNPEENINGGTKYMKKMLDYFDGDLNKALAAYNAGASNVEKYGGIPPFEETQKYVEKVNMFNSLFKED